MPYITQKERDSLDLDIDSLAEKIAEDSVNSGTQVCGKLNYTITKLMKSTLNYRGARVGYAELNELIGMLECCKLELYRRGVAPYEDLKIEENGDV